MFVNERNCLFVCLPCLIRMFIDRQRLSRPAEGVALSTDVKEDAKLGVDRGNLAVLSILGWHYLSKATCLTLLV